MVTDLCETIIRFMKNKSCKFEYVIIDIPATILCSYYYLSTLFPELDCIFIDSKEKFDQYFSAQSTSSSINTIFFVLPELAVYFEGKEVDIVVNSESFLEMQAEYLRFYLDLIFTKLHVKYFYSRNRKMRVENVSASHTIIRRSEEILIPSGWNSFHHDENFLLDSDQMLKMVSQGVSSSIEEVIAIKS